VDKAVLASCLLVIGADDACLSQPAALRITRVKFTLPTKPMARSPKCFWSLWSFWKILERKGVTWRLSYASFPERLQFA